MTQHHAVVIVGGGPTGLVLAAELALARVDVAIVERRSTQELDSARAGGLHARTLEVLDQRGVVERFVALGQKMQIQSFGGPLDIADVHRWRKIDQPSISADGQWVAYTLTPVTEGDNRLCLWAAQTGQTTTFERGAEPKFSYDGHFLVFKIKPALDTLKAQRRRKVKDEDLSKDSLAVFELATGALQKFPKVRSYALPEKWSGFVAYQLEPEKPAKPKKDSSAVQTTDSLKIATAPAEKTGEKTEPKKEDAKENGSRLVLRDLRSGREDTVPFVREYRFAKRGPALLLASTGRDSTFLAGVYRFDCSTGSRLQPLSRSDKGKFAQLALDEWGRQAAFLADTDTSKARIRPWQLCYWSEKQDTARAIAGPASPFLAASAGRPAPWNIG